MSTYHELKQLCVDARTEVRNCAIQTLFKTLSTHGSLLEHDIWPSVIAQVPHTHHRTHTYRTRTRLTRHVRVINCEPVEQILFPLMNEIRNLSASAGKNRIDTELGKEGGKSVIMYVSRSRVRVVRVVVCVSCHWCSCVHRRTQDGAPHAQHGGEAMERDTSFGPPGHCTGNARQHLLPCACLPARADHLMCVVLRAVCCVVSRVVC